MKLRMGSLFFSLILSSMLFAPLSSSTYQKLSKGSSLSVENPDDVLMSPNGTFSAGFYPVGINAYAFAIWFSKPTCNVSSVDNCTVVWMANRDRPVNGRRSKLSFLETGDVILIDAAQFTVWATSIASRPPSVQLQLTDDGNLVLSNSDGDTTWQSFDSPTDTLLPLQQLTRYTTLVSRRGKGNYSSGFYKVLFDDDNVLRLHFDGPEVSSVYLPAPWLVSWEAGRSTYNSSRIAMIDSLGNFSSTDDLTFRSVDYGASWIQRRLTIDSDGNLRLYSRREGNEWVVSWQAMRFPCTVHGLCGENGVCSYTPSGAGRKCSCPQGYKMKNQTDWSNGCEPEFDISSLDASDFGFIRLRNAEFYGYDFEFLKNKTLKECETACRQRANCRGFQYKNNEGEPECYPKARLRNGHQASNFNGDVYIKLPKSFIAQKKKGLLQEMSLECRKMSIELERSYAKRHGNEKVNFMLWFASALGGVEIISIFLVWLLLHRARQEKDSAKGGGYLFAATGFKRFTFDELKVITKNFSEEIGRGGGGIVYKGMLSDGRVVAVKRLNEANNHGEAEFLAEVNTIGKLNHMNLIEMWGFCAEKKHRMLVYEFMEHGSLAQKLSSNELNWRKRYDIALGTARGLAYLHDECLEWVLHCDVKPQNILLDSDYQPKVSDFGLSKLLDRGKLYNSSFSKIRGTRGYMAPEWVLNQPITSKVDVYSYGIVVLEMVTGKSPTKGMMQFVESTEVEEMEYRSITWVKDKKKRSNSRESWLAEIVDPMLEGNYEAQKMEILVTVALECIQEDIVARPTLSQVVHRLLDHQENEN